MIHAIARKVVAVPVVLLMMAGAHGKFRCAFIIHRRPLGPTLINRVAVTETAGNERRGEKPATL
jgi:hypothetical protein